jgi:hypothetical protein
LEVPLKEQAGFGQFAELTEGHGLIVALPNDITPGRVPSVVEWSARYDVLNPGKVGPAFKRYPGRVVGLSGE